MSTNTNSSTLQTSGPDTSDQVVGTEGDDVIDEEFVDTEGNQQGDGDQPDKVNGNSGSDVIDTGDGNDLVAGDMVGQEWTYVDGKWVFNPDAIHQGGGVVRDYNDTITTGDGEDVLLGNGGNDALYSGAGEDLINAGTGNDIAYGGTGDDALNLEDGNDFGVGGQGADVVNAGAGNDLVFGDRYNENILQTADGSSPSSFSQYQVAESGWIVSGEVGEQSMTQSVETVAGESYSLSFELAANVAGGATSAQVEVLWNGQVVGEVTATSGVYETFSIDVPGVDGEGELTLREVPAPDSGPSINFDGPIASYEKQVTIGGEDVSISAFAPGQAKLYQVIDGQLKVFDTASQSYQDAGDPTGMKINAIGFNVEDDLIYGIAKSDGEDALGNEITAPDLVMMDADGNAYRVGGTHSQDYVGDFDDSGNLWTFASTLNRVTKIDVNNLDANGNPASVDYDLPANLFEGRAYDIAYSAEEDCFFVVEAPAEQGGNGAVHKVDISGVEDGGTPEITSIEITGTMIDGEMETGMAKGAYGAVFLDGDGNLYYGMNRGDHDFDGNTSSSGGIYGVEMDWAAGTAHAKFMSTAQTTGSNDGAVDPRSADAFAPVDSEATVLIRNAELKGHTGGNDKLRGAEGEDLIYGGGGDDKIYGGNDDDVLHGDHGDDRMAGGSGDDKMLGGVGYDDMFGGQGNDRMAGGAGDDLMYGGSGDDQMAGGTGDDRMYGASGDDIIKGDAGSDRLYGGDGSDTVSGGEGDDRIVGGIGDDSLTGGAGKDIMYGGSGNDRMSGGVGDDRVYGGKGQDILSGGDGNDRLYGGNDNDDVSGGAGDDRLVGGSGNDRVLGGSGDDTIYAGSGNDTVSGDDGDDKIYGGSGDDSLAGGSGADRLYGGSGDNSISGGSGDDRIATSSGDDVLSGGDGSDFITAGSGDDVLSGGGGSDKLVGGKGADRLEGGAGDDHMWGGSWSGDGSTDTFVVSSGSGKDMIHDFEADHDVVDLSSYGLEFSDLSALMTNQGWATEIDLSGLEGGQAGDKILLKSIDPEDLDESNFIL